MFYPNSKDHLCTVTFGLMYGLYSRAASNQERPMMARVRYTTCSTATFNDHFLFVSFWNSWNPLPIKNVNRFWNICFFHYINQQRLKRSNKHQTSTKVVLVLIIWKEEWPDCLFFFQIETSIIHQLLIFGNLLLVFSCCLMQQKKHLRVITYF